MEQNVNVGTNDHLPESQIYNWGIKETEPTPAGESLHSSSLATPIGSASNKIIPKKEQNVNVGTNDHLPESQMNNRGIKKDTSLDGVRDDSINRKSHDASSDVSEDIIPQMEQNVNTEDIGPVREDVNPLKNEQAQNGAVEDIGPMREDTATKTEVDERFPMLDESVIETYKPGREDALRNADEEQTNSLTDEDMPPETRAGIFELIYAISLLNFEIHCAIITLII